MDINRKRFITYSAGALAAVSITSLLKASNHAEEALFFVGSQATTINGVDYTIEFTYEFPSNVTSCEAKSLILNMQYVNLKSGDRSIGVYSSEIKKCKAINEKEVHLKCCPYELTQGEDVLENEDFSFLSSKVTNIHLVVNKEESTSSYINLFNKKNLVKKIDQYVPEPSKSPEPGCFLTTVCVNHMGLNDNCHELEVLRNFRDNYMRKQNNGDELIAEYYQIGPAIVSIINDSEFKDVILSNMYRDLVKPSINLIEQNKLEEALHYYIDFTLALKDACEISYISRN
jgi:hypothetical protein